MMRRAWGIFGLLLASPAVAQSGGERLVSPALPGFVQGHAAANAEQSIREDVPRGETVENWTRMVTTQRFSGLAARTTPAAYIQTILSQMPRACPGARSSAVANVQVGGTATSRLQVSCPRGTGGRPETFLMLAIAGRADMHVKQVAFRGPTTPAGLAWANGFLNATVLCQPRDRRPACR